MLRLMVCALCAMLLCGCATTILALKSPETFAVCKTADITTTALAIHSGRFIEGNYVVASSLAHGYFPLIAVSVAMYEILKRINNTPATMVVNGVTCSVAAHNAFLMAY